MYPSQQQHLELYLRDARETAAVQADLAVVMHRNQKLDGGLAILLAPIIQRGQTYYDYYSMKYMNIYSATRSIVLRTIDISQLFQRGPRLSECHTRSQQPDIH